MMCNTFFAPAGGTFGGGEGGNVEGGWRITAPQKRWETVVAFNQVPPESKWQQPLPPPHAALAAS
jgi:hypothetical protein